MKNNKIISMNLVKEGLRQLRLVGIIVTVITVLVSFFLVYGQDMSQKESYEYSSHYGYIGSADRVQTISGAESGVIVIAATVIFSIIAMLMLFSFLNKRNASDFYHGIPFKRYTLCLSFCLAVLIWSAGIIIAGIAVSAFSIAVMKFVAFEAGYVTDIAVYTLVALVVVFFIEAVLLLSMSLSGTMLTNAAVAAMILLLPKCIFLTMSEGVLSDIPIYPLYEFSNGIFSGKYNLVTGWLNAMFGVSYYGYSDGADWYRYILASCGYTFILGAVIFAAGCFAFTKRKSEAATMAAASEKLQLVFRIIPAFVVTIIGCIYIYNIIISGEGLNEQIVFILLVIYITAIVVYYLYEIITTRKWRNIIKATPGLLVLLVLDVLYVGVMFIQRNAVLNDVPENPQSVRIIGTSMWDIETDDYFTAQAAKVEITDAEVLQILSNALEKDITQIKNNASVYDMPMRLMVCFNDNGRSLYRMLYMSEYDYNAVNKRINTVDYRSIIKKLATENISGMWISGSVYYNYEFYELDDMTVKEIFKAYMKDVEDMSDERIMSIALDNYSWDSKAGVLGINILQGTETYSVRLPIFYNTQAEKVLYEKINEADRNIEAADMIDMIADDYKTTNREFESNIEMILIDPDDNSDDSLRYVSYADQTLYVERGEYDISSEASQTYNGGDVINLETLEAIKDYMEINNDDSYQALSARLIITYSKYPVDGEYENYVRLYNIRKGDVEQIQTLINNLVK